MVDVMDNFTELTEDYTSHFNKEDSMLEVLKQPTSLDNPTDMIENMLSRISPWAMKKVRQAYGELEHNQILLGYADKDYETDPVIVNIFPWTRNSPQSTRWLISAAIAGSGKTVLGMNICEQYRDLLNYSITIFDAKPEAQTRKMQQDDPTLRNRLYKINEQFSFIKPKAWSNMVSVKPMFVDPKEFFNGIKIRYDLNDMELGDIITLFNFSSKKSGDYDINEKLGMLVKGRSITEEEGVEEVNPNEDTENPENNKILPCREVMDFIKNHKTDNLLKRRFKNLRENNVIGTTTGFDIVELLNTGKTVQYKTSTVNPNALIPETLAYMSNEIRRIGRGRQAAIRPKDAMGYTKLTRPALIYLTEYQSVYPRDPYKPSTKDEISNIYNTARAFGTDILADSTSLAEIHTVAIKQSDYILSFRLDGVNGEHLRRTKFGAGFYSQLDQIYSLEEDKTNPPFQCAIIKPGLKQEEPLQTFYPLPPLGSLRTT